ncbi:hypothetical protein ElyMa_004742200 [Elysia marginata]|uniref:Uncharacterized protein n=1 Tax=Elysia marginata TaxID=1093978 RepID=A0AAV4IFP2_9GAST|nr:hypothetical protein ElyMa_004742200 [Elysia marginata]
MNKFREETNTNDQGLNLFNLNPTVGDYSANADTAKHVEGTVRLMVGSHDTYVMRWRETLSEDGDNTIDFMRYGPAQEEEIQYGQWGNGPRQQIVRSKSHATCGSYYVISYRRRRARSLI